MVCLICTACDWFLRVKYWCLFEWLGKGAFIRSKPPLWPKCTALRWPRYSAWNVEIFLRCLWWRARLGLESCYEWGWLFKGIFAWRQETAQMPRTIGGFPERGWNPNGACLTWQRSIPSCSREKVRGYETRGKGICGQTQRLKKCFLFRCSEQHTSTLATTLYTSITVLFFCFVAFLSRSFLICPSHLSVWWHWLPSPPNAEHHRDQLWMGWLWT